MELYFIYNNLKVSPFLPYDAPPVGFDLLTYDNESWTYGTLWDCGRDAGLTVIGKGEVYGQLWVAEDMTRVKELEDLYGVCRGLTRTTRIPVKVQFEEEPIKATTFVLEKIIPSYTIIQDGKWLIKRN
jgi:hypothetical protein